MAATTPTLGLYKPGGGSSGLITPDETVDIDKLNANADLIDDEALSVRNRLTPLEDQNRQYRGPAGSRAGLSGMRLGDTYQETDSNKLLWRYDGTDWRVNPGLYLELSVVTTNISGSTETAFGLLSAPWVEVYDPLNWHDPVTNPTQVKPTIAGTYRITAHGSWADSTAGQRFFNVRKNSVGGELVAFLPVSTITTGMGVSGTMSFNGTTDVLDVTGWQNAAPGPLQAKNLRLTVELLRST